MTSLWFVIFGILAGIWRPAFLIRVEHLSARALDCLIVCLLFFTSLTFGLDPELSRSLGRLGFSSLVTAALVTGFSVVAAVLWQALFAKSSGRAVGHAVRLPSARPRETAPASNAEPSPKLMSLKVVLSVTLGWALGFLLTSLPSRTATGIHRLQMASLASGLSLSGLLLIIGYDLGRDRVWERLREYGGLSLTLPVTIAAASLLGAAAAGTILGVPAGKTLPAGAGFGWYSMAGAVTLEAAGAEAGAYVFMSNLMREILTILAVPFLSAKTSPVVGAAMGGATAMDSTLPVIVRSYGTEGAAWGLIVGTVLTLMAPFLLTVFLKV